MGTEVRKWGSRGTNQKGKSTALEGKTGGKEKGVLSGGMGTGKLLWGRNRKLVMPHSMKMPAKTGK